MDEKSKGVACRSAERPQGKSAAPEAEICYCVLCEQRTAQGRFFKGKFVCEDCLAYASHISSEDR